jgi:hypothetical protein
MTLVKKPVLKKLVMKLALAMTLVKKPVLKKLVMKLALAKKPVQFQMPAKS